MSAHRRLLLVDFDPSNIQSMTSALTEAGYKVEVARDGLAALEVFQSFSPDGVILEAFLPKKHGFEVCREIKSTPGGEHIPVVIATGFYRGRKHRNQALHEFRCDAYLERPFDRKTLLETLSRVLPPGELPDEASSTTPAPDPESAEETGDPGTASSGPARVINENIEAILEGAPAGQEAPPPGQETPPSGQATTPAPRTASAPPDPASNEAPEEPSAPEPEKVAEEPPPDREAEAPNPPETAPKPTGPPVLSATEDTPVLPEEIQVAEVQVTPSPQEDAIAAPASAAAGPVPSRETPGDGPDREVPTDTGMAAGDGPDRNAPIDTVEVDGDLKDDEELDRAFTALTDEPAPPAPVPPDPASGTRPALEDAIDERLESLFSALDGEASTPGPASGAPGKISHGNRKAPR